MKQRNIVALLGGIAILSGCGKPSTTHATAQVGQASSVASATSIAGVDLPHLVRDLHAASEVVIVPPLEAHNYDVEVDGEYVYRKAIDVNERNHGITGPLMIVARYRGVRQGVYSIDLRQSAGGINRLSCKKPCHFAKIKLIVDGEVLDSMNVPVTEGSVIAAVVDDVQSGRLNVYSQRGRP